MAAKQDLVNLDAMIKREDFAVAEDERDSFDLIKDISVRDLTPSGLIVPILRKPDFQRETNHWDPEQVVALLECFVNGDLIPSVILWKSPTYLFVIDGGHRLSVLRAWVEDDYGDGPISQAFFGYDISASQRRISVKTREMVQERVGTWQHFQARNADGNLDPTERKRVNAAILRTLTIQWVNGDADKAEKSFFKINTKGTPLDDVEELLLQSRRKPVPIAARAIIRAGKGHKYWSAFELTVAKQIESAATKLHAALFDPEVKAPIKTLDLPLGGPKGIRMALQVLIEVILISIRDQSGWPRGVTDLPDDPDGTATVKVLEKTLGLIQRITGNDSGSLGLHPAVYFYGPTGRHSSPMFMGTVTLIARKLANNDKDFFRKFSATRCKLEILLIENKDLLATLLQKHISNKRIERYATILDQTILALNDGNQVSESDLVRFAGLDGKIIIGTAIGEPKKFSNDTKSQVFIRTALATAVKCSVCNGYLDTAKSISYDHIEPVRDGGYGSFMNLQLIHPYCNQSIKS